ncbi:MAG: lysophospholipid acyltransferase family protein [Anaerolineae bacterium]
MSLTHRAVVAVFRGLTNLILRIDDAQLARVPDRGPLILVANHVDIMEAPAVYVRLQPRRAIPMVLADHWNVGWSRFLLNVIKAIPIRRGESDVTAMRQALEVLEAGYILSIAPEGTRSKHGRLQKGHPGVVFLALRSGAPLLPVVHYGIENYRENLRRLRRTDFHIVVGRPFYLDPHGAKATRQVRQQMTDEVMYQMAALLPPAYRGVYSDLSAATETYLTFQSDSQGVDYG